MSTERTWIVPLLRVEFVSDKPYDDVVADVRKGLGYPDFPAFVKDIEAATTWDEYRTRVEAAAGSSGLMRFLELDLGGVVRMDPDAGNLQALRIIAGNPVTMESIVRTSPPAGAFAPVTILIFTAEDGVHVRYDTLESATDGELSDDARQRARALDGAVIDLLRSAV